MDVLLLIIVAVLLVLCAVIVLKGRGERRATLEHEQAEAHVRAEKGKAQHAASQRRQADVQAAHAEQRAARAGTDTDVENAP
jgi:Na+-transporting methylmalonyl-CoA/oxaloacetate decarboxylase gamma subunit